MAAKTNLEMLVCGLNHIAKNYGIKSNVDFYVCGKCTIPMIADILMLCEDLGIDADCVVSFGSGANIDVPNEWLESKGQEEYGGLGFWQRNTTNNNPFVK